MQQLTPGGEQAVQGLASRYRISPDAVKTMLSAVSAGGGTMAQFYIPELGGGGQWMQGGMTMVGDMQRYTQFQVAQSMPIAAANEGGGGVAGIGVGLGAGLTMAQQMMQSMNQPPAPAPAPPAPAPAAAAPPAAGGAPAAGTKFCMGCGKPIPRPAKFCPECGAGQ